MAGPPLGKLTNIQDISLARPKMGPPTQGHRECLLCSSLQHMLPKGGAGSHIQAVKSGESRWAWPCSSRTNLREASTLPQGPGSCYAPCGVCSHSHWSQGPSNLAYLLNRFHNPVRQPRFRHWLPQALALRAEKQLVCFPECPGALDVDPQGSDRAQPRPIWSLSVTTLGRTEGLQFYWLIQFWIWPQEHSSVIRQESTAGLISQQSL